MVSVSPRWTWASSLAVGAKKSKQPIERRAKRGTAVRTERGRSRPPVLPDGGSSVNAGLWILRGGSSVPSSVRPVGPALARFQHNYGVEIGLIEQLFRNQNPIRYQDRSFCLGPLVHTATGCWLDDAGSV